METTQKQSLSSSDNRPDKVPKSIVGSVKMDVSRPWSDLPERAVSSILNKLQFSDRFRAFAVFKNWGFRKGNGNARFLESFPWVMSHERTSKKKRGTGTYSFVCELSDPHSRTKHTVINSLKLFNPDGGRLFALASKNGWVLLGGVCSNLFLHNPFTNTIKKLPMTTDDTTARFTMKGNPASPADCEIYMLSVSGDCFLNIETCRLSKSRSKGDMICEMDVDDLFYCVLHMNGNIYALFQDGFYCYNLKDESWKELTSNPCRCHRGAWLMEINENLILVAMDVGVKKHVWEIFRFDWTKMCWVAEKCLKSCAIYISGSVAFSTPLTDRYGKKLEGCKLFYRNEYDDIAGGVGFVCYSFSEGEGSRLIPAKEYGWINTPERCEFSFIEPPYLEI